MRRNHAPSRIGVGHSKSPSGFVPPFASSQNFRSPSSCSELALHPPKPVALQNPASSQKKAEGSCDDNENKAPAGTRYFNVVWCKQSQRKHKKWEGDALLVVKPPSMRLVLLKNQEGKEIGRGSGLQISKIAELETGSVLAFGGKQVELMDELTEQQFESSIIDLDGAERKSYEVEDHPVKQTPIIRQKPFSFPAKIGVPPPKLAVVAGNRSDRMSLFDPSNPDAIVMPRPSFLEDCVDVVIDPHLGRHLRPHQVEGVIFLYKCVMGLQAEDSYGAILADEMGLGKTLQTITLIWTLLKQGPFEYGKAVAKRAMVLCPSSLVKNWEAEFRKWLGIERIRVFAADGGSKKLAEYLKYPKQSPVLILSYELFTRAFEQIDQHLEFDLIVCDEGHRLKNGSIKASQMLQMSGCERRIVLTGTPVQNDLKEFHALVNIVCPDVLGSESKFQREFESAIVRSKQPEATEEQVEEGNEKAEELSRITGQFILRRTQDIISKYLPPKTEYILFCQMTALQAFAFERTEENIDTRDNDCIFQTISKYRKICNHPSLVEDLHDLPADLEGLTLEEQGYKLAVVSCLLHALRPTGEKMVLVSISTKVLDLLGELCDHYGYPKLRLDGSTSTSQRDSVVSRFNSSAGNDFVLLLSSKAGGTGLNLIGASRILLFDMDWNPATDAQAMSRVWRDGQRRRVHVYRLVTAGSIEEKIFQRQTTKQSLHVLEGASKGKFHFTTEELKDLFSFNHDAECDTHDLLECDCNGTGLDPTPKEGSNQMQSLLGWKHIDPKAGSIQDAILEQSKNYLSYVFIREAFQNLDK